mgnify:CR=1 FL=1
MTGGRGLAQHDSRGDAGGRRNRFIERALASTDQRIAEGLPVTPMFLFGLFLWGPVQDTPNALRRTQLRYDAAQNAQFGVNLPWVLLGVLSFPFLVGVGWAYVRWAERNEQDFAAVINRPEA